VSTTRTVESSSESERSISAVRWVLAFVGASLAFGSRATSTGELPTGVGIAVLIALVAAALSLVPGGLLRLRVGPKLGAVVIQILDVAAALGLVHVLSDVLPDSSWAVLTIPIVLASLRLNAVGVLWMWLASSLGYWALQRLDLVGSRHVPSSVILERSAVLLAIAAGVALLTRFLHAGWMEQAHLTGEAEARLRSVQAIELAGREMRGRTPDEIITTCLHHVLGLGFEAASTSGAEKPVSAIGNGAIIPADAITDFLAGGVVEMTEWDGPNGLVYSTAMLEPRSGTIIAGWSTEPPSTLGAEVLSELVAHASSGVELAGLMMQARYEADHDALTGLANRARFDRQLTSFTSQDEVVAMLFIDLDHFKQINDDHGHATGDWALQQVGAILSELVDGLAARYGGDEFVVVLGGRQAIEADRLAAEVHAAIATVARDRSAAEGKPLELSLSIGVAMAAGPVDPVLLRRKADDAVFQAKDAGRKTTATVWLSPTTAADEVAPPSAAPAVPTIPHLPPAATPLVPVDAMAGTPR
jgi:diguanylate cyclase (GGDEF)-like protein